MTNKHQSRRKYGDKKNIRKLIFSRRKEISSIEIVRKSRQIFSKVCAREEYMKARTVYTYIDFNREVMTRKFICQAWDDGKQVGVPKVIKNELIFYVLEDFSQLEHGYFGIEEPVFGEEVSHDDALMIIPGVAFDPYRQRIGYGQGFYDRYLSVHKGLKTIAVAFDFQVLDRVPAEETDIRPSLLITESRTY
ncbi:MAG: 5-formyltetrahydrofolate cyclo-ligase [Lachnospiraceae bacterium]|nr:5-formyltetrahydrofolate cyclo-ligase [Lachnospiraceae bacterium]